MEDRLERHHVGIVDHRRSGPRVGEQHHLGGRRRDDRGHRGVAGTAQCNASRGTRMIEAATQTPSVTQTWLPALLSAVAALVGAWLVYRNATKANRITEQNELAGQQLAWTRQAMDEARS